MIEKNQKSCPKDCGKKILVDELADHFLKLKIGGEVMENLEVNSYCKN